MFVLTFAPDVCSLPVKVARVKAVQQEMLVLHTKLSLPQARVPNTVVSVLVTMDETTTAVRDQGRPLCGKLRQ